MKLPLAILAVGILVFASGTFSSCKKDTVEPVAADTLKTMAANFSLQSLEGDTVTLSDNQGKVLVLFFFGYSCSFCKASAPLIQSDLVTPYASRTDYAVLGLDVWDGTAAAVAAFKSSTGLAVPLLLNASGVGNEFSTTNDRIIVVDQTGYIRFKGNQAATKDIDAARMKVDELLSR